MSEQVIIQTGVQDRRRLIERLALLGTILGLLSVGLYVVLYLQTGVWQILADAGLVALAILCMLPARWRARQGRFEAAGLWLLLAVYFAYGGGTVVWSGTAFYNALGGILLILLVASVIRPRRWGIWLGIGIIYVAIVALAEWLEPLPRYDIAESSVLRVHVPAVTGALVLLVLWQVARAFRVGNIRTRLLISFVTVALLPAVILAIGMALGGLQSWTYTMLGITAGAGLLGVLIAIGASLFITRSIATPLANLAHTATQIAEGELTQVARVEREDEIGTLAQAFNSMTSQLRDLIGSLEHRVYERTQELERRSSYLQASAVVSQAATSILETDELVRQVVELIQEQFGLYYVGLFLVDESSEWAVLRAGTGEAGRSMLARGHRIKVGEGMVGWSVVHAEPRVALEAEEDVVRLATAELPDTRSEATLPLRSARSLCSTPSLALLTRRPSPSCR
jgi:HAMP domain-containing protein